MRWLLNVILLYICQKDKISNIPDQSSAKTHPSVRTPNTWKHKTVFLQKQETKMKWENWWFRKNYSSHNEKPYNLWHNLHVYDQYKVCWEVFRLSVSCCQCLHQILSKLPNYMSNSPARTQPFLLAGKQTFSHPCHWFSSVLIYAVNGEAKHWVTFFVNDEIQFSITWLEYNIVL